MTRLLADALIEMTLPEKPRSRKQRYRATLKGRQALQLRAAMSGSGARWFAPN